MAIRLRVFLLCLAVLVVLKCGDARAQAVNDGALWLATFNQGDVGHGVHRGHDVKWWFDAHGRFFDDLGGFGQSIVRPGLGITLGDHATLWAGYAWIRTSPASDETLDEHRFWQQLTYSHQKSEWKLAGRSRLEQRFLETAGDTGWRFRQLFRAQRSLRPLPRLTLVAWDEIFFNFNDTDWGPKSGFDQNRAFVGAGLKIHPKSPFRTEIGYLNQAVDGGVDLDLTNHALSINFFYSR